MLLFSNGGAKKKKTKKSSAGRVSPVIDVRSRSKIADFEKLLEKGPITIVLIYADWCGACHRFREGPWNRLTAMPNKTLNLGAVREDMLANTSLNSAKISHYPSLLVVGQDKKPAEFKTPNGEVTNALPNNDEQKLEELLKTPVEEVLNRNSNGPTPPSTMANSLPMNKTNQYSNSVLTNIATPESDIDDIGAYTLEKTIRNASQVADTPPQKPPVGGGLYRALKNVINLATGQRSKTRRRRVKSRGRPTKRYY